MFKQHLSKTLNKKRQQPILWESCLSQQQDNDSFQTVTPDPPTTCPTWDAQGDLISFLLYIGQATNYNEPNDVWQLSLPAPFFPNAPMYGIIRKGNLNVPYQQINSVQPNIIAKHAQRICIIAVGCGTCYDYLGNSQDIVASFEFSSFTQVMYSQTDTYINLVYTLAEDVIFQIPVTTTVLRLQIGDPTVGPYLLPFIVTDIPIKFDLSCRPQRRTLKMVCEIQQ